MAGPSAPDGAPAGEGSALSAFESSPEHFRLLVEGIQDYALFLLDTEGRVASWNEGAERMTGYTADEIIGQRMSRFYPEAESQGKEIWELEVAESEGRFEDEGWRIRKDGSRFLANVVLTAVRDQKGVLRGFSKIVRDITDRRDLEQQLSQAQKMEAVGRLAGGIAHDFNNLLTAILGYTEIVLDSTTDADVRSDLEQVRQAAERGAVLVEQLMAFSRRRAIQPTQILLGDVVQSMTGILTRLVGEDVRLETKLEADVGAVRADRGQIEQLLLNLVVNARDAMPSGGEVCIQVSGTEVAPEDADHLLGVAAGPYVRLAVTDTGEGMDADVLSRCLEPFFTTKDPGRGTGLGLSIVYGIVTQSGGHVDIRSSVGKGTTVEVLLPRVPLGERSETDDAEMRPHTAGSETILLVEDEMSVRRLAAQVLRRQGYRLLEASDGVEALALAHAHEGPIELLVSDVVMPRLGGFELAEQLAASRPETKVLFISGYAERDPQDDIELLAKPFKPDDLTRRVRELLDRPA